MLEKVLSDDSFKVKTPSTIEARKCAEELLTWCLDCKNSTLLNVFNKTLADSQKKVIGANHLHTTMRNYGKNFFFYDSVKVSWINGSNF